MGGQVLSGVVHHMIARDWFCTVDQDSRFFFCRFTQLGLLRLLTAEAVMAMAAVNDFPTYRRGEA